MGEALEPSFPQGRQILFQRGSAVWWQSKTGAANLGVARKDYTEASERDVRCCKMTFKTMTASAAAVQRVQVPMI